MKNGRNKQYYDYLALFSGDIKNYYSKNIQSKAQELSEKKNEELVSILDSTEESINALEEEYESYRNKVKKTNNHLILNYETEKNNLQDKFDETGKVAAGAFKGMTSEAVNELRKDLDQMGKKGLSTGQSLKKIFAVGVKKGLDAATKSARALGRAKDYVKGKGWYEWPISHIPVLLLVSLVGITITFATQFGFLASFIFSLVLCLTTFALGAIAVKVMGTS